MKLSIALGAALFICTGSWVARAALVHHREHAVAEALAAASRAAAEADARLTPRQKSERLALAGLDERIRAREHRRVGHRGQARPPEPQLPMP